MRPDTDQTEALDRASARCEDCAPTTRWERRDLTPTSEAWLGTCELCGSMQVLALGADDVEIENPLAFFLLGIPRFESPEERPAWQRFYARTLEAPFNLRWRFELDPCETCEARASVGRTLFTPWGRRSLTLCLNCGFACVETMPNGPSGAPVRLSGSRWSPPDPAVKTLRDSVFETYRRWAASFDERRRRLADNE